MEINISMFDGLSASAGPSEHSPIGASSMHRWAKCPGSVRECRGIKSATSEHAEEGTKAHEFLAARLLGEKSANSVKGGDNALPPEMREAVDVCISAVRNECSDPSGDVPVTTALREGRLFVEKSLDLSRVFPGCYGTADVLLWRPHVQTLVVLDFKYGAGVPVDVIDNWQLLYYAVGAVLELQLQPKFIKLMIVQPRCPHPDGLVRSQTITIDKLREFESFLKLKARATQDPNAPLVAGDHCRWCPKSGNCSAQHSLALTTAAQEFSPANSYNPADLGATLEKLPAIEMWVKAVREFAYREATRGVSLPGWKLVPKQARKKWRPEVNTVSLAASLGVPRTTITEQKLLSPAQVEKAVPKAAWEKAGAPMVIKESSGLKLVPESDPAPAVAAGPAAEFKPVNKKHTINEGDPIWA